MQRRGNDRHDRLFLEPRPVERIKLHQVGNIDKTIDPLYLLIGQTSTRHQQFDHLFGHRRGNLKPNCKTVTPTLQLAGVAALLAIGVQSLLVWGIVFTMGTGSSAEAWVAIGALAFGIAYIAYSVWAMARV